MLKNIWGNNPNEVYLRKTFTVNHIPDKAYARIYCDTGYELFVNGRFVATVDEWCNTRDYDVRLFLKKGENIIAIHGVNHGGHRGLAFELAVDGKSVLVSNGQWKMCGAEKWGWILPEYNDFEWENARELNLEYFGSPQWWTLPGSEANRIVPTFDCSQFFNGNIPKTCNSPYWTAEKADYRPSEEVINLLGDNYATHISEECLPKIHKYKDILENSATENKDVICVDRTERYTGQSFIVDFGMQTIGYFRMKIKSKSSVSFRLYYGETLDEATYEISRDACQNKMLREEYRVFGGEQEFESRMRVEFRYIRVEFFDCNDEVLAGDFSVRTTLYPVNRRGYFRCDNEQYNKLWLMGERTVHYCMQEYYLDAPKRDRFLWTGDARLEALANYYMFADTKLMEFCLEELEKVQFPNGGIPSSYGEGCSMLWDYVVWYIISYYDYYMYTGNLDFVKKHTDSIYKAMDFMINLAGENGVISVPENPLGLWMVELNSYVGEDPYLNSIYLRSLICTADIATALGDKVNADKYNNVVKSSKSAIDKLLENGLIYEKMNSRWDTQIQYELAENELREGKFVEMTERINSHWLTMTYNGMDCLYEGATVGKEKIYEHNTTEPNYVSCCHGWTAAVNILLPMGIAGINPIEAGFKTVEIKPQTNIFKEFECVVPTPKGDIAVKYCNDEFSYCLPKGVTAKITLNNAEIVGKGNGSIKLFSNGDV